MRDSSVTKKTGSWDFGDEVEPRIHRIHAYPAKFPAFITSKAIAAARQRFRKPVWTDAAGPSGCKRKITHRILYHIENVFAMESMLIFRLVNEFFN